MKVECPYCSETTELEEGVACSHCEKSFSKDGWTFAPKPLFSALSAFVLTAGGFLGYDRLVDSSDRYPLEVEFALVSTCATGGSSGLTRDQMRSQAQVCLCAVEKTTQNLSYSEYQENESQIGEVLDHYVDECV